MLGSPKATSGLSSPAWKWKKTQSRQYVIPEKSIGCMRSPRRKAGELAGGDGATPAADPSRVELAGATRSYFSTKAKTPDVQATVDAAFRRA